MLSNNVKQKDVKIVRNDGCVDNGKTFLVCEHKITLFVDDKVYCNFTCLNTSLEELVLGRLYCDGKISRAVDVSFEKAKAFVSLDNNDNNSSNQSKNQDSNSCENLDYMQGKNEDCAHGKMYNLDTSVFPLVENFMRNQEIHKFTSGTHSCIVAINGKIKFMCEDIGRHNVMDKAIGYVLKSGANFEDAEIFTSARVSTSIVEKCIHAGIKSLITKSVCTSDAADLAKGKMNLICKAWPDSYEVYC